MKKQMTQRKLTTIQVKVLNLLLEGNNQSEIAIKLNRSRPRINQIVMKLLRYGTIEQIPGSGPDHTKRYRASIIHTISKKININQKYIKPKIEYSKTKCLICGDKTPINPNNNKPLKYCCSECKSIGKKKKSKKDRYCPKFNSGLKLRVRAYWNYTCFACGAKEEGKVLAVHHILYNPKACCRGGGDPLLIPLCISCHNHTSHTNDRKFWEKLFYNQLQERSNGTMKCFFSRKEWKERQWLLSENVSDAITNGLSALSQNPSPVQSVEVPTGIRNVG